MGVISHKIHFYNEGFFCNWEVDLPYRIVKDDILYESFFDDLDLKENTKLKPSNQKWFEFVSENTIFKVDYVAIGLHRVIDVFLKVDND